ncbi:MAG: glycoside hydrolase [Bacillota bacterium]|jgi:spore germination protein YaaH|nr:glycoside hydrolase [Bacillota bacterium]
MKRKWIAMIMSAALMLSAIPTSVLAAPAEFTDLPAEVWAVDAAHSARDFGLMEGSADGNFGFGKSMTKAEFVTVLGRMFGWQQVKPEVQSFSDVGKSDWYFSSIETALQHKAIENTGSFSPGAAITREEMAVMLVRALGYDSLAQSATALGTTFADVKTNVGYITVARDIGMTKGTSETTFSPSQTAKREEAAAMMVRVYEKYTAKTEWLHGFYAISSYSQKELIDEMDAVSTGWSRMSYDPVKGAYLNTTSSDNNEFSIPAGYESITSYLKEQNMKTNLSIYADTTTKVTLADGSTDVCSAILLDSKQRTQAVQAILNELTVSYNSIGYNPYSGVTIDFEGMKGSALKEGFNDFLKELSAGLKPIGKSLYVAVPPAVADGYYYDGYDFRTIGQVSDKLILMAHDYHETVMPDNLLNSEYYRNTPLTPFYSVYYGLKAVTDETTGVEDLSKVALAISFNSVGWELENGKLSSTKSVNPPPQTIYNRLKGGAQMGYSELYRNPYITYTTEDGKDYFVWYEDERSVSDKIMLARLFGIDGVSLWRIGTIPNYSDEGIYYNVMESLDR